jgi:hypothetical protein
MAFSQESPAQQKNVRRKMAKQRMIVTDDQLLIDMELLFNAIREAKGDWQKVEQDMQAYLHSVQSMVSDSQDQE